MRLKRSDSKRSACKDLAASPGYGDLGPASTSFFFSNLLYLELLWIHDEEAARQNFEPLTMNTIPRMNWRESGASPINLMLRSRQPDATVPPAFSVHPLQLPGGAFVGFNGETLAEPCYGIVPEEMSFRGFRANIPDLPHPLGVKQLTSVGVTGRRTVALADCAADDRVWHRFN